MRLSRTLRSVTTQCVAGLGAFDVERTGQGIAAGRELLVALILSAGIQCSGDDDVPGLDAHKDGVGVRERSVVVVRHDGTRLSEGRRRGEQNDQQT